MRFLPSYFLFSAASFCTLALATPVYLPPHDGREVAETRSLVKDEYDSHAKGRDISARLIKKGLDWGIKPGNGGKARLVKASLDCNIKGDSGEVAPLDKRSLDWSVKPDDTEIVKRDGIAGSTLGSDGNDWIRKRVVAEKRDIVRFDTDPSTAGQEDRRDIIWNAVPQDKTPSDSTDASMVEYKLAKEKRDFPTGAGKSVVGGEEPDATMIEYATTVVTGKERRSDDLGLL